MATNVEVVKTGTENSMSLLRRFTKRVQGSGVLPRVRSLRYKDRNKSPGTRKKMTLKKLARRKEVDLLRKLNRSYRRKDCVTDILSFALDKKRGEIFINSKEAEKESKKFGREFENFLSFLFIHGLVHLKGFEHGSRMETQETKFRKKFGI